MELMKNERGMYRRETNGCIYLLGDNQVSYLSFKTSWFGDQVTFGQKRQADRKR